MMLRWWGEVVALLLFACSAACAQQAPKAVIVHGQRWKLKLVDKIDADTSGDCTASAFAGDRMVGLTTYSSRTIEIDRAEHGKELASTLLHELMHAATPPSFSCSAMRGHHAVYVLSEGLAEVLKNNPALRRFLDEILN